ncbi:PKD domain-containing protein [Patescibacteria group bacterium]|nr:MAG: PKD domain-containing protein [Patescibacteria group bacterium]
MRFLPSLVFSLLLLLAPTVVRAASPLVITEISTIGAAEHEWLEIQNISEAPIDLTLWKFWEQKTNHGIKSYQGGNLLPPQGLAIIAGDAATFLADKASSTLTVFDSAWGSLAESGEEIGLRDASGTLAEVFTYPATKNKVIERRDSHAEPLPENWCERLEGDSAGLENDCGKIEELPAEPTPPPLTLKLSEIFPAPAADGKEWVELFNAGPATVPADFCELHDSHGKIASVAELNVPAAYLTVYLPSAKLNNDGDTVSLICNGATEDTINYGGSALPAPEPGQSIARETLPDGAWRLTAAPTPGGQNVVVAPISNKKRNTSVESAERRYPPGRVLVNEIYPDDALSAWVELANPEPRAVSLAGWRLRANTDEPVALTGTLAGDAHLLVPSLTGAINKESGIIFLIDPEGYTSEQVIWGSGDGTPEDNAPAGSRPGTSIARVFDGFSSGNAAEDFAESATPTPGGTNEITTLLSGIAPLRISEILPNPAGPDALGEFVEIQNISSSSQKLAGWKVAFDSRRPSALPEITIPVGGFVALNREEIKIALPNSGAELALIAPDGAIADRLGYEAAESGIARGRGGDGEPNWTSQPTPGETNIIAAPVHLPRPAIDITRPDSPGDPFIFDAGESWDADGPLSAYRWDFGDGLTAEGVSAAHVYASSGKFSVSLAVADAAGASSTLKRSLRVYKKDLAEEEEAVMEIASVKTSSNRTYRIKSKKKTTSPKKSPRITLGGIALAERGPLGAQTIPVLTETGGILIELPKDAREINRGDRLKVTGTTITRSGQERVRAQTIAAEPGAAPEPQFLAALEEAEDAPLLTLLTTEGTVIDKTAQKITLSRQGELDLKLPTKLKSRDAYAVGAEVRATGILRLTTKGERELAVRDGGDLQVLLPAPLPPRPGKNEPPISPASAGATGAAGGVLLTAGWGAALPWRRRLAELAEKILKRSTAQKGGDY